VKLKCNQEKTVPFILEKRKLVPTVRVKEVEQATEAFIGVVMSSVNGFLLLLCGYLITY
jgi:hypothetical protein